MEKLLKQTEERMQRSIDAAKSEFATVRTGRATPGLLDRLRVNYYGTESPINQVATVSVPESRLLLITPWDKSSIPAIEKAILTSDLNLQPSSDGQVVRIAIPPLTEERRQELAKVVQGMAEEARISVRNIRRDTNGALDKLEKSGTSEDDVRRGKDKVQKFTDKYIEAIGKLADEKVAEIMEI